MWLGVLSLACGISFRFSKRLCGLVLVRHKISSIVSSYISVSCSKIIYSLLYLLTRTEIIFSFFLVAFFPLVPLVLSLFLIVLLFVIFVMLKCQELVVLLLS
jgi:hypothetical protein